MNQHERFWEKVIRHGPDECWPWTGGVNSRGYGRLRWDKEPELANRVAWIIAHGPIAPGAYVLMNCGNPLCCNVAHMTITEGMTKEEAKEEFLRDLDRSSETYQRNLEAAGKKAERSGLSLKDRIKILEDTLKSRER